MPAAVMENFEGGMSIFGSESQSQSNWGETQVGERMGQRRQRNRDAARKSRKKQTEKADLLHEELQALEQSNAAYTKEIAELKKELEYYTTLLQDHEAQCTLGCWAGSSVPNTASTPSTFTSDLAQTFNQDTSAEPPSTPLTTQDQIAQFSLAEILDQDEWHLDF